MLTMLLLCLNDRIAAIPHWTCCSSGLHFHEQVDDNNYNDKNKSVFYNDIDIDFLYLILADTSTTSSKLFRLRMT